MFLDLHHYVMDVDQLSTDRQCLERRLREHLLKTMVVLDELSQSTLSMCGRQGERGREGGGRGGGERGEERGGERGEERGGERGREGRREGGKREGDSHPFPIHIKVRGSPLSLTCRIAVPFLKLVKDCITPWLSTSMDLFHSAPNPLTSCWMRPTSKGQGGTRYSSSRSGVTIATLSSRQF